MYQPLFLSLLTLYSVTLSGIQCIFLFPSLNSHMQGSDGLWPTDFTGEDSDFTPYSSPYTTPQKFDEKKNSTPVGDNVVKALFK